MAPPENAAPEPYEGYADANADAVAAYARDESRSQDQLEVLREAEDAREGGARKGVTDAIDAAEKRLAALDADDEHADGRYTHEQLLAEARTHTGYPAYVLKGALAEDDRERLTPAEAKRLCQAALKRPAAAQGVEK